MNWNTVKPSDIKSIHMRNEGDVNSYWRVTLKDGTTGAFYGYETGPHYEGGPNADYSLWDDNSELYNWLCDLNAKVSVPHWNEDEAVDFDLTLSTRNGRLIGTVSNIEVQHNDDGKWERVTKHNDSPSYYLD